MCEKQRHINEHILEHLQYKKSESATEENSSAHEDLRRLKEPTIKRVNGFIKYINEHKDDQRNKGNCKQKEEAIQRRWI